MGGRGSSSSFTATATPTSTPAPTQPTSVLNDDNDGATSVGPLGVSLADVQAMDDKQLHDFLIDVYNTDIPDFLNSVHLQKMLYALNMNDGPEIVSQSEFDDMTVNAPFGSAQTVLYRTVNSTTVNGIKFTADDICDMLTDGDTTFVGNGIYGDGLYFSNSLSGSKAYGYGSSKTVGAVFNSKSRMISDTALRKQYDAFVKSHPQTRKALGFARSRSSHNSMSQFALIAGYNVITSSQGGSETYYNVLDRSVLTMTRKRY